MCVTALSASLTQMVQDTVRIGLQGMYFSISCDVIVKCTQSGSTALSMESGPGPRPARGDRFSEYVRTHGLDELRVPVSVAVGGGCCGCDGCNHLVRRGWDV